MARSQKATPVRDRREGIWRRVKSLFSSKTASSTRGTVASSTFAGSDRPRGIAASSGIAAQQLPSLAEFEARLKGLAAHFEPKTGLLAGKVQLIAPDKIQERPGNRCTRARRFHKIKACQAAQHDEIGEYQIDVRSSAN